MYRNTVQYIYCISTGNTRRSIEVVTENRDCNTYGTQTAYHGEAHLPYDSGSGRVLAGRRPRHGHGHGAGFPWTEHQAI